MQLWTNPPQLLRQLYTAHFQQVKVCARQSMRYEYVDVIRYLLALDILAPRILEGPVVVAGRVGASIDP